MGEKLNIISSIKRTILIVEDEIVNQEILKEILKKDYEILVANNGIEGLDILKNALVPISLILLDINMPVMGGLEFLDVIKKDENYKKIPVIVLTREVENELKSLKLGAVDFIKKPYDLPEIVLARVSRSIELSEDRNIIQLAERDPLTGIYSWHVFSEYAQKIESYKTDNMYDLIVLNISKFHIFNELYGRERGDEILVIFSEVLKSLARKYEGIVGKLQSDYFALYILSQESYSELAQEITDDLLDRFSISNIIFRMGIYQSIVLNENIDYQIDKAKLMCDLIRGDNRTNYKIYNPEDQKNILYKDRLESDFQNAIKNREFKVVYQPKVNIQGEKYYISSAEALVRWFHPEFGVVSPGIFIPLFEGNGFISILDRYVWEEAANQIARWKEKYNVTIPISVNLSRLDLYNPNICKDILEVCKRVGIDNKDLYIELTESAYSSEAKQMIQVIQEFKEAGFKVEIDDFGCGYSSLNTLATLSFDVLKLDMQFVREMNRNEKTLMIVKFVADIAKFLNVPIVAEGVETKEQLDKLKEFGYDLIQGYYFSKPLVAEEFEELFIKGK
ncbi:MAG: EAL domain-containing protein [Bacilli bacterium]|nr:EAL domain-containing protein [Bacilli bacterium]